MTRRTHPTQRLAQQAFELSLAAPQVVAQRLTGMALAGPRPSAKDRREMQTMGTEKVIAFWQSWAAMGWQAWRMQRAWMTALARQPFTPPRVDFTPLLAAGLAPVHRKATANARRLSRPKR